MSQEPNQNSFKSRQAIDPMQDQEGIVLKGAELLEYVVSGATNRINNLIRSREEQRFKKIAIVLSVVGIIGLGSIIWSLKILVKDEVTGQLEAFRDGIKRENSVVIEKSINSQIGETKHRLYQEIAYQQLTYMALSLDMKDTGFSNEERDAVVALIKQLAPNREITNRKEFGVILEKIIDTFASANLIVFINEIDDILGERLLAHRGCTITLVSHFGQHLVGDPDSANDLHRLEAYAEAAHKFKFPELATLWQLLYKFKAGDLKACPPVDEYIRYGMNLQQEEDRERFMQSIHTYSDTANWQRGEPSPQGKEIERVVNELIAQYPEIQKRPILTDPVSKEKAEPVNSADPKGRAAD